MNKSNYKLLSPLLVLLKHWSIIVQISYQMFFAKQVWLDDLLVLHFLQVNVDAVGCYKIQVDTRLIERSLPLCLQQYSSKYT